VLLLLLSIGMLPALHDIRSLHQALNERIQEKSLAILMGVEDREADATLAFTAPLAHTMKRVLPRLEADHRNLFADPRKELLGLTLRGRFVLAPGERCTGGIDEASSLPPWRQSAAAIRGWGWDTVQDAPPAFVVVTDHVGYIRGLADFVNPDPETFPGSAAGKRPRGSRWSGYVSRFDHRAGHSAYGVLADGRTACLLGSL